MVMWLVASGALALHVSFAGSYNKTYGSLATIVVFLLWLWITNITILLGGELSVETEHQRAIQAGVREEVEPFVDVRDDRKLDDDEKKDEKKPVADAARVRRPRGNAR